MSLLSSDDSLEVFRLVVDQAPDAIIFADGQGMIQVWNNAAADVFGYPRVEVIDRSLLAKRWLPGTQSTGESP